MPACPCVHGVFYTCVCAQQAMVTPAPFRFCLNFNVKTPEASALGLLLEFHNAEVLWLPGPAEQGLENLLASRTMVGGRSADPQPWHRHGVIHRVHEQVRRQVWLR